MILETRDEERSPKKVHETVKMYFLVLNFERYLTFQELVICTQSRLKDLSESDLYLADINAFLILMIIKDSSSAVTYTHAWSEVISEVLYFFSCNIG